MVRLFVDWTNRSSDVRSLVLQQFKVRIGQDGRVLGEEGPSVNNGSSSVSRGIVGNYGSSGDVRVTVRSVVDGKTGSSFGSMARVGVGRWALGVVAIASVPEGSPSN